MIGQFIKADHVPTISGELSIIYEAISYAGITSVVVGLLYIALEPFVRRSWSEMLISWNRFLAGDFRDPMIGRDILGGGLFGLLQMAGVLVGFNFIEIFLIDNDIVSGFLDLETINNLGGLISAFLDNIVTNTALSLVILFIALFFYRLTGRKSLGILSVGLVYFILNSLIVVFSAHWGLIVAAFIHSICLMIALYRYGLLGLISFWFFWGVIGFYPITFDTGSFYFPQSILTIVVLLGIVTYSCYISIAGQPIFGGKILKEFED